jgi:hypothetical protein
LWGRIYSLSLSDDEILQVVVNNLAMKNLVLAVHVAFGTVIPLTIIILCNVWIVATLQMASKKRKEITAGSRESETRYLTRMLIIVCVAYVILSLPWRMYDLIISIPHIFEMYDFKQEYWRLRYDLQYVAFVNVWYVNHAVNFYLYVIGGGRKYRRDIAVLLSRCRSRCSSKVN